MFYTNVQFQIRTIFSLAFQFGKNVHSYLLLFLTFIFDYLDQTHSSLNPPRPGVTTPRVRVRPVLRGARGVRVSAGGVK